MLNHSTLYPASLVNSERQAKINVNFFCKLIEILHQYTFAGVTILLSLTVFLNLVAESMPTTSDAVPLIGI